MKHKHLDFTRAEKQALVNEWKLLRYQREWTLRQAAKMIGIDPACLCRIENGQRLPGYEALTKISLTIVNAKIKNRQSL
jgi:DNA-binding XRE family transcriptional regulator